MKIWLLCLLVALASPTRYVIPAGTVSGVEMTDTIDSKTAKSGDVFHFETIEDTELNGKTLIPKHSKGLGIVSLSVPAAAHGKGGTLVLEARYLKLPSGQEVQVTIDRRVADLSGHGATSTKLPWYTQYLPVPGLGMAVGAYDYLHNGKNVQLEKGTIFAVFSIEEVSVNLTRPEERGVTAAR